MVQIMAPNGVDCFMKSFSSSLNVFSDRLWARGAFSCAGCLHTVGELTALINTL